MLIGDGGGDFETRSAADLRKVGMYRYAEHPSTDVWVLSWHVGAERGRWHPGDSDPTPLLAHVAAGGRFVAHNAPFERVIWNTVVRQKHCPHWPPLQIEQMDCTMSRALAIHLPADLDSLGQVLGLPVSKDMDGAALMKKMAKPRRILPPWNPDESSEYIWWDSPENRARLDEYCDRDDDVEAAADKVLPPLSDAERALWELDQRINDRGVLIDTATVEASVAVLAIAQKRADDRMRELTEGAVAKCTEAGKLVRWLAARGVPCDSVAKDEHAGMRAHAEMLGDDVAVAVLTLRGEAAKNSTAKFRRMLDCRCDDGRLRGMLAYHRAATGRWGGALVQPHNLPRVDPDKELPAVLEAIAIMEQFA
jgi:DNA polymerase